MFMLAAVDPMAVAIFAVLVAIVLGLSFYLGQKAKSAQGYYAAHGEVNWFVNGVAFAGDYLSAASFLGICGMIALYGYDGFLYSIGFLAGWVVALFLIAEPMKKLGKFTFADALDSRFNSTGIKLAAAIGTLIISIAYLIPQMVGAGALVKPLLGLDDNYGILIVGVLVTIIVVTAGMVSTTWVQFIKGSLLVIFCAVLVGMILTRGFSATGEKMVAAAPANAAPVTIGASKPGDYVATSEGGHLTHLWRKVSAGGQAGYLPAQWVTKEGEKVVSTNGSASGKLKPVGGVYSLPDGQTDTGSLGPVAFLSTLNKSTVTQWAAEKLPAKGIDGPNTATTVYYPKLTAGSALMVPGQHPTFKGIHSEKIADKLDFISFMIALFCGTASLPHILIRYYTVKNAQAARKSTVVGIVAIGIFYTLTLFLGLGAMTAGRLDLLDPGGNKAAPLLAQSFSQPLFALISAIAFTTVLGTVSGLILAGSGAVAHDLVESVFKVKMNDRQKVMAGKAAAVGLGLLAMLLGVSFKTINVSLMVAWAFNIAASANLPALIMLLYWPKTTKQGITASVLVGVLSSATWIALSDKVVTDVYKMKDGLHILPFNYPALATIPLAFITLIVVSLLTQPKAATGMRPVAAGAAA